MKDSVLPGLASAADKRDRWDNSSIGASRSMLLPLLGPCFGFRAIECSEIQVSATFLIPCCWHKRCSMNHAGCLCWQHATKVAYESRRALSPAVALVHSATSNTLRILL